MSSLSKDSRWVTLTHRCQLACPVCDCHESPSNADAQGIPTAVFEGGNRLVLRGESALSPAFARTLEAAQHNRWSEVIVRTNGQLFTDPDAARTLRSRGVRGVILPLFSHTSAVHDRIAGRAGVLVASLRAMRSLVDAGLSVSIEIPVLSSRLQQIEDMLVMAHRAAGSIVSARFFSPRKAVAPVLAPPLWNETAPRLRAALTRAKSLDMRVSLGEQDGIPLCVLGHDDEFALDYHFNPRKTSRARDGFAHVESCSQCAVRAHCLGPTEAYGAANKSNGLTPFRSRPRRLFEQRTTPARVWTEEQKAAASRNTMLVLRPTVNCNQDCSFCSANETSQNVYDTPDQMLRKLARAARQGIEHLSFSGGEPTLMKELVHYVRTAKRLGFRKIELISNGVRLTDPERVRALVDAGLTTAFVSLHAHDEILSSRMTRKEGDWERSVRAITLLSDAGLKTDVNHVVNAVNARYLHRFAEFVVDRWQGRVGVSFAFITPQFKALDDAEAVPRMSDVMPYLRRGMKILEAANVRFVVGSRQGVPPCLLGEFEGFSDVIDCADAARSEDEPQKIKSPVCKECKWDRFCTGLWRPYAARYGLDELVAVPGEITQQDVDHYRTVEAPFRGFQMVPAFLRTRPAQPDTAELVEPPVTPMRVSLPVLRSEQSSSSTQTPQRVVRLALLGSSHQAQRLARAISQTRGVELVGVSSPHIADREEPLFSSVFRTPDPHALVATTKPDALVIATATHAHHTLVLLASEYGLPCLVEKPFALNRQQAEEMLAVSDRIAVVPAHAMAFSPGMRVLRSTLRDGSWERIQHVHGTRAFVQGSSETPVNWSREALYQLLYHAVYWMGAAGGSCAWSVDSVDARGESRPEWISANIRFASGVKGTLVMDFQASRATSELFVRADKERMVGWRRDGAREEIIRDTALGARTSTAPGGNDSVGMLEVFAQRVRGESPALLTPALDGLHTMLTANAILDGLHAFLTRPHAPKHVSSRSLRLDRGNSEA